MNYKNEELRNKDNTYDDTYNHLSRDNRRFQETKLDTENTYDCIDINDSRLHKNLNKDKVHAQIEHENDDIYNHLSRDDREANTDKLITENTYDYARKQLIEREETRIAAIVLAVGTTGDTADVTLESEHIYSNNDAMIAQGPRSFYNTNMPYI